MNCFQDEQTRAGGHGGGSHGDAIDGDVGEGDGGNYIGSCGGAGGASGASGMGSEASRALVAHFDLNSRLMRAVAGAVCLSWHGRH